jgi:C1A family cysteine protease
VFQSDKQYGAEEHSLRFSIFQKNLETIEKHNSEYSLGMHTYRLGINHFADLTTQEFREFYLGTRVNFRQNTTKSLTTFQSLPGWIQVPEDVDWRKHDAVTPVKNQEQCGSCWAFSTTGALEGAHARAAGQLVSLSEQQLVDCSSKYGNNGCNGGLMDNAFEYVVKNGGLDTEDSYPYHAHVFNLAMCFKASQMSATKISIFLSYRLVENLILGKNPEKKFRKKFIKHFLKISLIFLQKLTFLSIF